MTPPLRCPKCSGELPGEPAALGAAQGCPTCRRSLEGVVFPAFRRPTPAGRPAESLLSAEDAGCFYHPQSRAQVPCDTCGRFLCALCDVELAGQHICPACLNTGRKKKRLSSLDNQRILYGGTALVIAVLPVILFWPFTIFTGPLAVFLALYGWRKPRSLVRTGRGSAIVAILLGLAQTLVWVIVLAGLFKLFE